VEISCGSHGAAAAVESVRTRRKMTSTNTVIHLKWLKSILFNRAYQQLL